jgi:hypothetical protein
MHENPERSRLGDDSMKKFEVSVTAELFFEIEAEDEDRALAEAQQRAAKLENGFPTPDGQGRIGIVTYSQGKSTFSARELPPGS